MQKFEIEDHEHSLLPENKKWKLVWHDEFDGDTLDESKWSYRLNFWGERAEQFTDKGVSLDGHSNAVFRPVAENGMLKSSQLQTGWNNFDELDLQALKDRFAGKRDEAGYMRFWCLGELKKPKFMHTYGYYEARVKFQKQSSWWSAFWLQAPAIGSLVDPEKSGIECDIMENFVDGQLTAGNINYSPYVSDVGRVHYPYKEDGEYHRFGVEWSKDGYVFYFDGKEVSRTDSPISRTEQFILLSTEIKGYRKNEPKTEWTEEELNDRFICDYVRVFDEVEE